MSSHVACGELRPAGGFPRRPRESVTLADMCEVGAKARQPDPAWPRGRIAVDESREPGGTVPFLRREATGISL